MFIEEEDWSDEPEAPVPNKTVIRNAPTESSTNVKSKCVGKKSLLRTLQVLGSVPEWKNDEHVQDSDSETEATPSPSKKKKRKKKRKRAGTTGQQQDSGNIEQTAKEETVEMKKRKKDKITGAQKVEETSDQDKSKSAKVNNVDNSNRLNRQQWKNKMKNKKKCKNKYSQKKPEEGVNKVESRENHKPEEAVKPDLDKKDKSKEKISESPAEKKKKKEKEGKAQKRKITEENAETSSVTEILKDETGGEAHTGAAESKQKPEVTISDEMPSPTKRPALNKEQNRKREKLRKLLFSQNSEQQADPTEPSDEQQGSVDEQVLDRSASLRSRMEQRLESARFRYINEVLYSTTSSEARRMFKQDPQAFGIYHRGYTAQVQRWPANPVEAIISYIKQKPSSLVVADFGCGDCKIACSVKNKVHSFDLAAVCEQVTVCDMANVPLDDASVHIAVFCLSLMGTNLAEFLAEANRVLKMGGVLKIAEVASRFENVRSFTTGLANLGFKMMSKDTKNTHFYSFDFVKTGNAPERMKKFGLELKPCVYKKR